VPQVPAALIATTDGACTPVVIRTTQVLHDRQKKMAVAADGSASQCLATQIGSCYTAVLAVVAV